MVEAGGGKFMPNIINLKYKPKTTLPGAHISPPRLGGDARGGSGGRNRWYIPAGIFIALIVIILSFVLFKKDAPTASAQWYNDDWHYRQQFDVFNASTTEDLLDFQVELPTSTLGLYNIYNTEGTATKSRSDFFDLRFTDMGGNLLDYWFPDATSTMQSVYVKFPTLPMNATSTLFMYYGNNSATDERNGPAVFPDFFEDFEDGNYAMGKHLWSVTSGAYTITGDEEKYLQNSTAGVISTPSTKAYGTWEFSLYKGGASNSFYSGFISDSNAAEIASNGYSLIFYSDEGIWFYKNNIGSENLLNNTAASYFAINTWYRLKVTRTTAGVFTFYIKGGAFGSESWTLVDVTGGSGTNPVTNNTYTTSAYFVNDLDASDRIDNILWRQYAQTEPDVMATAGTSEEIGGGPVGFWKFDEGYGTTAFDSSSYKNNGTLTNMSTTGTSTAWQVGKVGKGLMFDGVNDRVVINSTNLVYNSQMSWSFWIKPINVVGDDNFYGVYTSSPENRVYFWDDDGILKYTFGTANETVNTKVALTNNQWHHLTFVYNGTNLTTYYNGQRVHQFDRTFTGIGTTHYVGTYTGLLNYFSGLIDEPKIYNYALTSSQIKAEYNQGKSIILSQTPEQVQNAQEGLWAYWKMDKATSTWDGVSASTTIDDYSGNGHYATDSGGAKATTTAKYGNSGEFDGVDDYLELSTRFSPAGNDFTLEAWVSASTTKTDQVIIGTSQNAGGLLYSSGHVKFGPSSTALVQWSNAQPDDENWHHLAVSVDCTTAGDSAELFIDGVFQGEKSILSFSATGGTGCMSFTASNEVFRYIASDYIPTGDRWFAGLIDDVKIYNTARTSDQIMQDYLEGPGPMVYYDFEEGSGTTLYDKSGQGYNSSSFNGGLGADDDWVKGKYGRALDFDKSNDYINFGDVLDMETNSFSLSAWIFTRTNSAQGIITKRTGGAATQGWNFMIAGNGANGIAFMEIDDGAGHEINAQNNTNLVDNKWHHVLVTANRSGNMTVYTDGVAGTAVDITSVGNISNDAVNLHIGARNGGNLFGGLIDEVRIFNYALTSWQIAQEYNQGDPIAHWSFDEGQGTTANNISATSTGTLTNMDTTGTSTAWVTGKIGKALLFDGINDTVTVTDSTGSGLDITSAGSMSAWIKPTSVSGSKYIIDKDQTTAYSLMISGATLYGYFDIGGSNSCSGGTVKANVWQYVAATFDGNYIHCYIDGVEVNKTADTGSIDTQDTTLYIGSDGGAASWFSGLIDEPKIYQYALSPAQIKKDYNDGLAVQLAGLPSEEAEGLVGWYRMDESTTDWDGAGDRVNDYSGNGNNGTAYDNAHATTTAVYGNAGEFDGTDDYVSASSNNFLSLIGKPYTLEAWVFDDTPAATLSSTFHRIISWANGTTNIQLGLANSTSPTTDRVFYIQESSTGAVKQTTVGNVATGWNHIAATSDGSGGYHLYLNGYPSDSGRSASSNSTVYTTNTGYIYIGQRGDGGYINGLIDDVKIYNVARTPDQIMQDYLQGPGPIAYYDFEEGSGLTANDKSGQGYNGTITAGTGGYKKGKIGRAYDFDGNATKIDCGSDFISTNAVSISAWVYAHSVGETAGRIITNGKFELYISTSANSLTVRNIGSGASASSGAGSFSLNRWYHIVITRASGTNGLVNFYFNGVQTGTANQPAETPVAGTSNVIIGSLGTIREWDGLIDDLKVYNYVMTPWQVAQEYNGGGPVAHWKMDEGQGQTIYDWSGNNYTGTLSLNGSPATSTAWQTSIGCKVGKCLSFDGTDDYVSIGSSLNVTGEATVSAWIRPGTVAAGAKVIAGDSNSGNTTQQLSLQLNNTAGKVSGKWGNSTIITSSKSLQADTWYYVTLTRSGSTGSWTANLYINGALDNTATTATNPSTVSSWSIARAGDYAGSYFQGKIDDLKIYNYARSPQQVKEDYNAGFGTYFQDTWVCGDYFTDQRDGHTYDTVAIGSQCWMQDNLNYGTIINSPAAADVTAACTGNVGTVQTITGTSCYCVTADYASCQRGVVGGATLKYCYSNTESYCTSDGALYEWQEAMDLDASCAYSSCTPASGNQGICPAGWHIPTDAELKTLEMNQGMSQAQADTTGWRGITEGDKLKGAGLCQGRTPCATSRFDALLAGYRNVTGAFGVRGSGAYFWSSSQSSAFYAWGRVLGVSYSTVHRNAYRKYYGFSIRCLKD